MKSSPLVLAFFLGLASSAESGSAIPDYWNDFYGDTWRYTGDAHLVNSTEWIQSAPTGYSLLQRRVRKALKHKNHHKAGDWSEKNLKYMGDWTDHRDDSPAGYNEHLNYEPSAVTASSLNAEEHKEVEKEGNALAKESRHSDATHIPKYQEKEAWRGPNIIKQRLSQDIHPYRTHAWNDEQYNFSDEDSFKRETDDWVEGSLTICTSPSLSPSTTNTTTITITPNSIKQELTLNLTLTASLSLTSSETIHGVLNNSTIRTEGPGIRILPMLTGLLFLRLKLTQAATLIAIWSLINSETTLGTSMNSTTRMGELGMKTPLALIDDLWLKK
jgi:hypothetical protein